MLEFQGIGQVGAYWRTTFGFGGAYIGENIGFSWKLFSYLMMALHCWDGCLIESILNRENNVLHFVGFSYFYYFSLFVLVVFLLCGCLVSHGLFPKSTLL